MSPIFESLFAQYATYESLNIILEITGVVFGLLSVWFAKKNPQLATYIGMNEFEKIMMGEMLNDKKHN